MKNKLIALAALLLFALTVSAFRYQSGQRWEYKVDSMSTTSAEMDSVHLNGLGRDGWELVAVERAGDRRAYFFKRPKP